MKFVPFVKANEMGIVLVTQAQEKKTEDLLVQAMHPWFTEHFSLKSDGRDQTISNFIL